MHRTHNLFLEMDALKAELERKRKAVKEDFGGRKFVRRGEIDQRELERRKEEEKKELLEKSKRKSAAAPQDHPVGSDANNNASVLSELSSSQSKETATDDMLLKDEVIKRLRYLKQPITLFGEDDEARAARLKALMKTGEIDSELMEGQRNDFLVDMAELRMLQKHGRLEPRKEKNKEKEPGVVDGDKDGGGGGEENITGENGFSSGIENDKDVKVCINCQEFRFWFSLSF